MLLWTNGINDECESPLREEKRLQRNIFVQDSKQTYTYM